MRDWGRLRHNDHCLWWSILARNKRSVTLNLREPEGQRIAARPRGDRRHRARELPPRHDGEVGARARGRPRAQPARASTRASPATARPAATRDRPGLRVRRRGDRRPALHQRLPRPGAAARPASSLGDTLAAQSAFQGILLALYARERGASGPGRRRRDRRRVLRDDASRPTLEYEKTGFVREPTGPRLPRIAPSNVYLSQGRQVGRDRGQPRHAVAPAGRRSWASRSSGRTSASPPTTRAASTRTCSTRSSARSPPQHTAEELDEIVNEGGVVCAPVYTAQGRLRRPVLPRARAARGARGRGPRAR